MAAAAAEAEAATASALERGGGAAGPLFMKMSELGNIPAGLCGRDITYSCRMRRLFALKVQGQRFVFEPGDGKVHGIDLF